MFFVSGSATPDRRRGRPVIGAGAKSPRCPIALVIEGHTDARPLRYATATAGYSTWVLAVDRAHEARRGLNACGLRPGQVAAVRGFADHHPFNPEKIPRTPGIAVSAWWSGFRSGAGFRSAPIKA